MERVKIVKVGDGEDIHTIRVGDTVDAKYNRGEKFYKATVVKVNSNHTYDLEYYDGAKEEGVEKKLMHKILPEDYVEPEAVEDSSEEEEEEETKEEAKGGENAPPPPLQITDGGEEGTKEGKVPPPAITVDGETPDLAPLQITDGKEGEEVVGEGAIVPAGDVPAGDIPVGAIVPAGGEEQSQKKKKKKYKKVTIRFVHDLHEEETTTEHLQPTAWLGTLPSEAAKAHRHEEAAKYLLEMEDKARKAARKKFRAVQALAIGMFAGRDEKKYEGMV